MKYETGWIVAGAITMAVIGFMADQQGFKQQPGWISVLAILLLATPSCWAFMKYTGYKKGLLVLACLSVFAILIETIGVATGFPYGSFTYSADLGWRVFGLVPWTVPFAWVPLLIASAALASYFAKQKLSRIFLAAMFLVLMDLVLDPAAVHAGLWSYPAGGWYFGVPWTNFAGWMFSGILGASILALFDADDLPMQGMIVSAALMLAFWSGVLVHAGLT
ncbi:carotenoid biosynthesis protein [Candidatus Uhrbacteria bacterium]|nr:carotenoid biosynthesis protein [Candidatus Uhrbacteria bacterium]